MSSIHTRRFRRALLATAMAATTAVGTLALPAAGVAAALGAAAGVEPRSVDISAVQAELRAQSAIVNVDDLD